MVNEINGLELRIATSADLHEIVKLVKSILKEYISLTMKQDQSMIYLRLIITIQKIVALFMSS